MFEKKYKEYVIMYFHDNGGIVKSVLHNKTAKQIAEVLEYYKNKAYWYEEVGGNVFIAKGNQPV